MISRDKQGRGTRHFRVPEEETRKEANDEPGSYDEPVFEVGSMSIRCRICETEMLLDDAVECPFCQELFCPNHVMECEACGKVLCVDCMEYPEDEPICPECEKMMRGG